MTTLLVSLPMPGEPADTLRFVLWASAGGEPALQLGSANRLPKAQEVVAVVPSAMLSWHLVNLPKKTPKARWRQALDGLLEERLLSEPGEMHLAVAPDAAAGNAVWVAACSKVWLRAALQAAGQQVSRVVPEHAPLPAEHSPQWHLTGLPEKAQLVQTSDAGVVCLPLGTPTAHSLQTVLSALGAPTHQPDAEPLQLHAEPAMAALAERALGRAVPLRSAAQTLLSAEQSQWNLAQFDLASTGSLRLLQRAALRARHWLNAPAWRATRWGLVGLLAAQVIGLNLWAWQEDARIQAKQATAKSLLTQTFPRVGLVVNAPLQMERESAALAQARGLPARGDLESLLVAVAQANSGSPTAMNFAPGELRLTGLKPDSADVLTAQLKALGYSARADGANWTVRPLDATPGAAAGAKP